ncbi:hypothetical protein [Schleiferilactobacillus perolens]|uniref:hypothetical protein n=1 Tax=Schleiferilactobacillus perolens TaxID=100468 RepID=UPI0039E8C60A
MNVILAVELAHSSFYYYSIAALSYLGVLLLFWYYCRTCILTPDRNKKIFILLLVIIVVLVVAILLVGVMAALGYVAAQPHGVSDTDLAWGATMGLFLDAFAGWVVPVLVNYYYFKQEIVTAARLQVRQHFYATNRLWLLVRASYIFIIISAIAFGSFLTQLFAKITSWTVTWRIMITLGDLVMIYLSGIIGWWALHSNDWIFLWKPQLAKNDSKT